MVKDESRPYLIVGQGITGTCLSFLMTQRGIDHVVMDTTTKKAASSVAAGLINPLTGRHFVKSWMIEQLIPKARQIYAEMELILDISLFQNHTIHLLFQNNKSLNDWHMRTTSYDVGPYAGLVDEGNDFLSMYPQTIAHTEILGGAKINLKQLIFAYRSYLEQRNQFINQALEYDQITDSSGNIDQKWEGVIFCEGAHAVRNPFFNYLPFWPTKGEVLLVKIPNYPNTNDIVKCGVFIIPTDIHDVFWIGSTYDKKFEHDLPEKEKGLLLHDRLEQVIGCSFTILDHQAAIRPTVKDRKPFLGQHPTIKSLYILNGMGAKASSLAPYFADHFCQFLFDGQPLMKLVDISRYQSLCDTSS